MTVMRTVRRSVAVRGRRRRCNSYYRDAGDNGDGGIADAVITCIAHSDPHPYARGIDVQ